MTKEKFQKELIALAQKNKEFAAIPPFATLTPAQTREILNVSASSLRSGGKGTHVLSRIDVSSEGARRRSSEYNKREVYGLLMVRQAHAKKSAEQIALEILDNVA